MKRRTHPSNYRFESKKNRWWQLYGNLPYNFLSWCINSKQDANKFFRSEKKLFSSWEKWIFLTNVIMIFWINTPLYQMFFPIKRSYYIFKKFIKALGVYWWKYVIPLTKVLGFGIYFYASVFALKLLQTATLFSESISKTSSLSFDEILSPNFLMR